MQAALERRDLAHKISHELGCAGPESPQTTEGLNDEWFTAVLTIAYSLSSEEWNLVSEKKKGNCISTSSFNIFKFFLSFLLEIRCLKNRLKNKFKKRACKYICISWATAKVLIWLFCLFVYSHIGNILKKVLKMKSSEVPLRYFFFSHEVKKKKKKSRNFVITWKNAVSLESLDTVNWSSSAAGLEHRIQG